MSDQIPGIRTTYPYETTSPGVARFQCTECGAWERSDKSSGRLVHSKRCDSRPQPPAAAAELATEVQRDTLRAFARQVKRTHMTHGRDADVRECIRLGLLDENDALNTDD